MNFDIAIIDGMSRFDPKIHVVIEGAEFADYFLACCRTICGMYA